LKKGLNSDGQQFHQFKKTHAESPLILTNWTQSKDHHRWRWKYRSWLWTDITMWRY
jgi:hypothetical protein